MFPRVNDHFLLIKAVSSLFLVWTIAYLIYLGPFSPQVSTAQAQIKSSLSRTFSKSAGTEVVLEPGLSPASDPEGHVSYFRRATGLPKHEDRVAVIVEERDVRTIPAHIAAYRSVLGEKWPMVWYTRPAVAATMKQYSHSFRREVEAHHIEIRYLPDNVTFTDHHSVSIFLADPWLWEATAPYSKVLMFQLDGMICSSSPKTADDFIEYDFIGAPIPENHGLGVNGGICIRNRELFLDIARKHDYRRDSEVDNAPFPLRYEDQWFFSHLLQLPRKPDGTPGAHLPTADVAKDWVVEEIWNDKPLGFHRPHQTNKERMAEILRYCPEVGILPA